MKTLLMLLTSMIFCSAFAAEETSVSVPTPTESLANIHQGNLQMGGGFSWTQTTQKGTGTSSTYSISPSIEYFVVNRVSMGGTLTLLGATSQRQSGNYTGYGLGPSASLYFFNQDKMAAYLAQSVSLTRYSDENEDRYRGVSSIGVKYFAVPQVAFGVALAAAYDLGEETKANPKTTSTSVDGTFSFYY